MGFHLAVIGLALLGLAAIAGVCVHFYRLGRTGCEYQWRADAKSAGLDWRALDNAGMTAEHFAPMIAAVRRKEIPGLTQALVMARLAGDGTGCGAHAGLW